MRHKNWYTIKEAEKLDRKERVFLTKEYVNPGMVKLFRMLGFDQFWAEKAEGMYIYPEDGEKILDMTGGNCVLGLGHNHPRILRARKEIAEKKRIELCKSFLSPYMAALAANIASILPGDLQYSFFCNSGAESIEGALKLAQKHHGTARPGIIYTDRSFHGKTYAAMSVSSMEEHRHHFRLLDNCFQVPYGDAAALKNFLEKRCRNMAQKPDICAIIMEAIHGTRLIFPPEGYLKKVRKICDEYDILLILDEIYTGFGRTGRWFAFQEEEIIPDIVCYSKTFGGGKATIAGYTARKRIFLEAYGDPDDSMIHSSTFSGMTEECATAIESLNIIKDEELVERSAELGKYLGRSLQKLREKHKDKIKDIRGRGLLWGIEINPFLNSLIPAIEKAFPGKSATLDKVAGAVMLAELLHTHRILAYLGFTRRNLIVLSPSLIVREEELDMAVQALDSILSDNWLKLISKFINRMILK